MVGVNVKKQDMKKKNILRLSVREYLHQPLHTKDKKDKSKETKAERKHVNIMSIYVTHKHTHTHMQTPPSLFSIFWRICNAINSCHLSLSLQTRAHGGGFRPIQFWFSTANHPPSHTTYIVFVSFSVVLIGSVTTCK